MPQKHSNSKAQQPDADRCAMYLKALGDPNRLQIMRCLRTTPLTVTDLALLLESEMSNVSHHLRVLYHAGLVTTNREGKFIYYQINQEVLQTKTVAHALDFGCCRLEMRS
jgi:DNA-binding transcriptional ArsR family regulator